jgi:hypothetical protein
VARALFPELSVLHNSDVNASRGREGVSLYDVYPCVVLANARTHNHNRVLEQKPLASVRKREAAAYGSP